MPISFDKISLWFWPEDPESLSVDELVNHYDATHVNIVVTHALLLEKNIVVTHAPLLVKNVRMRTYTACYNDDLREHTWHKSKLEVHKQMFREQCKLVIVMHAVTY